MTAFFEYDICYTLTRLHYNPPIALDAHPHDFLITLHLRAQRISPNIYGLDMVKLEHELKDYAEQLPSTVNDHPRVPTGTTEELCEYFATMPLAPHIQLLSVSVGECPERLTRIVCA